MVQQKRYQSEGDLVANWLSFLIVWGVPVLAMGLAGFLDPLFRTMIWVLALIWMGGACVMNGHKCGRIHCKFTGPFFLLMTVPVVLVGVGMVSFGSQAWWWLAGAILIGTVVFWWGSEAIFGKYRR